MNGYYKQTKKDTEEFYGVKFIDDKLLMKENDIFSYLIEDNILEFLYDKFKNEVKYKMKTLNESQLNEVFRYIMDGINHEFYCPLSWTGYEFIYNEFYCEILEEEEEKKKIITFKPRNKIDSN